MNEIMPCPFCGSDAEIKTWWGGFAERRYITTVACTRCRGNSGKWKQKPKAIEAWNKRAENKEKE